MEFIHGDKYAIALEMTKKFVARSESRPILNYAQHAVGGDIVATDSHRLIRIRSIHGFDREYLINPKTFMAATGNFPDTERLASLEDHDEAIILTKEQIKIWFQLFKSINQTFKTLKDRNECVTMTIENDIVAVSLGKSGIKIELPTTENYPVVPKIHFKASYMRDALETHYKMDSESLTIYLKSSMTPIILDDDQAVQTLILPVRVY